MARDLLSSNGPTMQAGGIIRGRRDRKRLALVFTGHQFAEGGEVILDQLKKHGARGSFFVTGDFLVNPAFSPLIHRIQSERHYLGPHSDKHLLFCSWDTARKTLVTRQQFQTDIKANIQKIEGFGVPRNEIRYFLPAYEHYNLEIAGWAGEMGLILVDFTPGARSNADYTGEADKNFVSSKAIFDSIVRREQQDDGLNGFLLLLHLGAGPGRTDKFHPHFGALLTFLRGKGYQLVFLDELFSKT